MSLTKNPVLAMSGGFFYSLSFELVVVLLFGVASPTILTVGLATAIELSSVTMINSFVGASLCALAMMLMLRRFRLYPGTAAARSILPVLCSFYAALLALVALLRVEYSNQILFFSFIATLVARYAIETLRIRAKKQLYYVVPGGRAAILHNLIDTTTIFLNSPSISGLANGAIIADLHADLGPEWERFLAEAAIAGKLVYHYKQVWEAHTGMVQIDHLSENSFGALVPSFAYQKFKRLVDLTACILVLPFALPIMLICAFLVKHGRDGPVFFRQRRIGFRGKVFQVIKFRTMTGSHNGADRELSVTQTDDHRITRTGRFLRQTRLDELPQIFNIIRGEMSWIGPRPEAVSLSSWYEAEIPFYRYRHIVRPGITGWAQVNQGHVTSLGDVDDKLQYDFYYIKNLSYWLDILIAGRTMRVMLTGFGAK